ncbi:MAG: hypothetical protein SPJ34_02585 [Candidatus Ornithospirochaeta sp.]|nr:hypothetical protein [Candidatus Ornithospirochaeta sp.]
MYSPLIKCVDGKPTIHFPKDCSGEIADKLRKNPGRDKAGLVAKTTSRRAESE